MPISPLLFCPIVGDAIQSLLIRQERDERAISPLQTVRQALGLSGSLLSMKLYFEGAAVLYALIPIYGIIQDIRHRLYWAMASNVLVFENLSGEPGRNRCRAIVQSYCNKTQARTLVVVPALLLSGCFLALIFVKSTFDVTSPFLWFSFLAAVIWITFPLSGAVNTFLYLEILKQTALQRQIQVNSEALLNPPIPAAPQKARRLGP